MSDQQQEHCGECSDLFLRMQALEKACEYAVSSMPEGHLLAPTIVVDVAEQFERYLRGEKRKTADLHVLHKGDCQGESV